MARRRHFKRSKKAGLPPGTLMHFGEKKTETVQITFFDYDLQHCEERSPKTIEECFGLKQRPTVSWINIDGLHDVEVIEKIGRHYDVHPLILEDILSTGQRPKYDDSTNLLFLVFNMLSYDDAGRSIQSEQVSVILGPGYVLSFQESPGDVFDPIRERIRSGRGKVRSMGADYLMYTLMDAVVDGYFLILEKLGEQVEALEQEVIRTPDDHTLKKIYSIKRELIYLRKSVWPLREVFSQIEKTAGPLIADATKPYFRDIYDHTIQAMDSVEMFRDTVSGLLDIYLTSLSNRMNAVMKVLTIIATIFIPLTFIVGIYGMNFKYMPELNQWWAYPAVWGVMIAVVVGMVIYFKKNKWM